MLNNYELFLENIALQRIDESILYFSPKLRLVLGQIDHDIGKALLDIETEEIEPDITLLDLDREGYFSFTTERNVKKRIADIYRNSIDDPDRLTRFANDIYMLPGRLKQIWKDDEDFVLGKQSVRIGKLINRLFPKKYSDKEVEEFVNKVKALVERAGENISVVSGQDIAYWYSSDNYYSEDGNLGNSCMRYRRCHSYFGIYTDNPKVCKLIILTELGKLKGRALLWKVDGEEFEWFMDRQYTNFEHDVQKLRSYATSNGWAYRTHNDHIYIRRITFNGEASNRDLKVNVKAKDYHEYPYMDTFKLYYPDKGELLNTDDGNGYLLQSTDGGYDVNAGLVWSEYHGESIPEEEAVYSEAIQDWIYSEEAVEVEVGTQSKRGYYPRNHADISFDTVRNRWLHRHDSIWSSYHDTFILHGVDAIEVVSEIKIKKNNLVVDYAWVYEDEVSLTHKEDVDDMLWYQRLESSYSLFSHCDYILSDILTRDSDDNFIPEDFKLQTFKVKDRDLYLTMFDSIILELYDQLDESEVKIKDTISYNTELFNSGLLKEIISKSKISEDRLNLVYNTK